MALRVAWLALLAAAACAIPPDAAPPPGAFEDVRRIIATLDDVAGEYPRAVARGAVTDPTRMRVLARQLHDATVFAWRMPAEEQAALRAIQTSVAAHADPAQVADAARALRAELLDHRQLVLGPGAPPPRERGEELWQMLCAGCHGRTGAGDGEQGLYLVPEPKDFQDPELLATLAPTRAFSRISDGVPGTDMPQWGLFSTAERWALASLVFAFRHDPEEIARGRAVVARLDVPRSPRALADRTNAELLADLRARGLGADDAGAALAYLRAEAAFELPPGPLAALRARLAETLVAYRERDWPRAAAGAVRARHALIARSAAMHAADPEAAARLEHQVLRIEHGIAEVELAEVIERDVTRADAMIDRAERQMRTASSVRGVRVALIDGLAAAIALGLVVAASGLARRRWIAATASGAVVGAIAGTALAAGTASAGACLLALVASLVIARATSTRAVALGASAALVVNVIAGHARVLGVLPWLGGVAVLAAAAVAAGWVGQRARRPLPWFTTAALVVTGASVAGRGAWWIAMNAASAPRLLAIPRVDALGVYPTTIALIAAGCAALAVIATARARS